MYHLIFIVLFNNALICPSFVASVVDTGVDMT